MKKITCPIMPTVPETTNNSLIEIIEKNRETEIVTKNEFGTSTIHAKNYPSGGRIMTVTQMPKHKHKYEFADDIEDMLRDGHSQKEIAKMLEMSQGYVSKLHKQNKNSKKH